jgi:hypothetical protein
MYDSVTVKDIPQNARMVAGYVDGLYANVPALHTRFPNATVVTITVFGARGAHVIDCEPGDATPSTAAAWAKSEIDAGRKPTIYCMASQWTAVKLAVAKVGVTGKVSYWIANYDNHPLIPPGAVAKQYANPPTSGGHYDLSVVVDYWPGVDPEPSPPVARLTRLQIIHRLRSLLRALTKGNRK